MKNKHAKREAIHDSTRLDVVFFCYWDCFPPDLTVWSGRVNDAYIFKMNVLAKTLSFLAFSRAIFLRALSDLCVKTLSAHANFPISIIHRKLAIK